MNKKNLLHKIKKGNSKTADKPGRDMFVEYSLFFPEGKSPSKKTLSTNSLNSKESIRKLKRRKGLIKIKLRII